ncbi:MAG: hypothetical protein AMXMBFR4_32220 [Candidatus Hydrogenedentota bacterium]
MEFWVSLWKWVFILSVGAFSLMSVWVTIQGAFDIRSLLRTLREEHAAKKDAGGMS